jgi:flagellar biosynthetic protein FliR
MLGLPEASTSGALEVVGSISGSATPELFLAAGLVVLARVIGFMVVVPFFGSQSVPMQMRVAIGVVLTAVITPYVADTAAPGIVAAGGGTGFALLLANQVLIGVMLGFVGAFLFFAIEAAGRVLDVQRGDSMPGAPQRETGSQTSPSGNFLMYVALMILIISGQHMRMLGAFIDTFRIFPATTSLDWMGDPLAKGGGSEHISGNSNLIEAFAYMSGHSLELMLQIAAPAMLSLLLADVLLGIINRGAPQVNVFALSQVVKGPIGLAALVVALTGIGLHIEKDVLPNIWGAVDHEGSIRHIAQLMRNGGSG